MKKISSPSHGTRLALPATYCLMDLTDPSMGLNEPVLDPIVVPLEHLHYLDPDPAGPGSPHTVRLMAEHLMHALSHAYPKHHIVEVVSAPWVQAHEVWRELGYPTDARNLDGRYTRWINSHWAARSQMSATIPAALRALAHHPAWLAPDSDGVVLCLPGTVWRKDLRDKTHLGAPRQMDIWVIHKPHVHVSTDQQAQDLLYLIDQVVSVMRSPSTACTILDALHPYTQHGKEVLLSWQGMDLEVLECGIASPQLLAQQAPTGAHGLALGLGLDRACMIKKNMPDIRGLVDPDPKAQSQCHNLSPWKSWSRQPAAKRDLSIALPTGSDEQLIAHRISELIPTDCLENIDIVSRWPYEEVPPVARERLGIDSTQEQWLIRITLRSPDASIPVPLANGYAQAAYDALHAGSAWEYRPND